MPDTWPEQRQRLEHEPTTNEEAWAWMAELLSLPGRG